MKHLFKRGFAVTLCMALVCGLLSGAFGAVSTANAATEATGNLLTNPSFEEASATGWSEGIKTSEEKFAGAYSLKIQDASATETTESVSTPVAVAAAAYIANVMVKSAGVEASVGLRYFDANGNEIAYLAEKSDPGATGWQEVSVKLIAPAEAATVAIVLGTTATAQGAAYFDSVELIATANTAIDPVLNNSNFEAEWNTETGVPSGWNNGCTGATASIAVTDLGNGNHVLQMEKQETDSIRAAVNSGRFPVSAGEVYNLAFDARNISGGATVLIQLYFYDAASGGSSQNVSSAYVLGSDWETIYLTAFAPGGYSYAYIDISVRNAVGVVQIDNVSLSLADGELLNASFEGAVATDGSPNGWSKSAAGTNGCHDVVSDGMTGNALMLNKTSGNGAVFSNFIPVTPGMTYEVTFYEKGDAVTSLSQVIPCYYTTSNVLGTNSAAIGTAITTATLTPSADWTKRTVTFTAPDDAIAVRMAFLTRGSTQGKIYFDDVTFASGDLITNGDCSVNSGWTYMPGTIATGAGPDGSDCIMVTTTGSAVGCYQNNKTLVGGMTYRLSVDYKLEGISKMYLILRHNTETNASSAATNTLQYFYPGDGSWQHAELIVTLPSYVNIGRADVGFNSGENGTMYIDNFSLVPLADTIEKIAITNAGFEDELVDIKGWYNRSGVSLSSDYASDGSWSVLFPVSGNQLWSDFIPVTPGQKLTCTVDANPTVNGGVQMILYGYAASDEPTNYTLASDAILCAPTSPAKAENETWVTVSKEATVPDGINYVRFMICTRAGANNSYVDNASLTCAHTFGEWNEEVPATHTANGTKGYKACIYCDKKFDATGKEITDLTISNEAHAATPTDYTKDATHHWYKCTVNGCNEVIGAKEEHVYTDAEDNTCNVCGYERGCQHANMQYIDAVAEKHTETELKGAVAAHKKCLDCGKLFTMENTETTIEDLTADAPTHSYGAWAHSQDGTKHERSCSCGKTESGDHTGGTATCTDKKVCTVCSLAYGENLGHALTPVGAVAEKHTQTELVAGVAAHYKCGICNKLFLDADGNTEVTLAELTGETPTHAAASQWAGDANNHWHECTCGLVSDLGAHTPLDDDDRCDTPVLCSVCGQVVVAAKTHVYDNDCDEQCNNIDCLYVREAGHNLTAVPATPATTEKEGNEAYWTCECGKWFADAEAKEEITDKDSVVIDKLTQDSGDDNDHTGGDTDDDEPPKTGEGIVIAMALTLLTLCGAAVIFVNTKFGFRK